MFEYKTEVFDTDNINGDFEERLNRQAELGNRQAELGWEFIQAITMKHKYLPYSREDLFKVVFRRIKYEEV